METCNLPESNSAHPDGLITAQGRQPEGRERSGNTNRALCLLSHRLDPGKGQTKGYLGIINISMELSIGHSFL